MNKIKCPNCGSLQLLLKHNSNQFQIYYCRKCLTGFTYPAPKNMSQYYDNNYWSSSGIIGIIKDKIYNLFQIRRKYWVTNLLSHGGILDVGSGEGIFSTFMSSSFKITSIDTPFARIKNPNVVKVNFLDWRTTKKFDAIVFWESLEHTQYPKKYLKKAVSLLKKGGYIFIEYPRSDCWEARLFKRYWFHLDPPRHLAHLTPKGLGEFLSEEKLNNISHQGVAAFEYTLGGFVESVLNLFFKKPNDFFKNSKNSFFVFLLIPVIIISIFVEIFFYLFRQSPIYLTVAKKT